MSLPQITDQAGRMLPLDRQLGAGAEGTVYALANNPNVVAKISNKPLEKVDVDKLIAMVGLGSQRLLGVAAWPTGLVLHARTRQVVGFTMPRLNDYQELW